MRLPSYLQKNKYGKYYFRIVFPKQVRLYIKKREYKKSLGTTTMTHAVEISRIFKIKLDRIFRLIGLHKMDWYSAKQLLDKVAVEILKGYEEYLFVQGVYPDVANEYPERKAEEDAQYFLEMKRFPNDYFEREGSLKELHQHYGEDDDIVQHILWRRDGGGKLSKIDSIKGIADQIIADKSLEVLEKDYDLFCQKVAEMLWDLKIEREELRDRIENGERVTQTGEHHSVKQQSNGNGGHGSSVTFDELVEKFIDFKTEKQDWGEVTLTGHKKSLIVLAEIVQYVKGRKRVRLADLTADDVKKVEYVLRRLPANRNKRAETRDLSLQEIIRKVDKKEIAEKRLINDKTYNGYCILFESMMKFAVEPRQGYIKQNYFTNMKVKVKDATQKIPFTNSELTLFFNTELFTAKKVNLKFAWKYWIPVMMLYHGARLEEVAQGLLSDIAEIDGVWCFKIIQDVNIKGDEKQNEKKVKNANSVRYVPLHEKVLGIGFLDYVDFLKGKGEGKLFPHLSAVTQKGQVVKQGKKVTAFFNEDSPKQYKKSYLTHCGIKTENTPPKTKSLICFRHTVEKVLNDHEREVDSSRIDQLMGHSPKSIGKKHYAGYSVATMKVVVDLVDFPDANLPWDTNSKYGKIKFEWES